MPHFGPNILNPAKPPVGEGRIRPPFSCVSYEATKKVSQWQRIYDVGLHRPPV